jgi:hypothetical protein
MLEMNRIAMVFAEALRFICTALAVCILSTFLRGVWIYQLHTPERRAHNPFPAPPVAGGHGRRRGRNRNRTRNISISWNSLELELDSDFEFSGNTLSDDDDSAWTDINSDSDFSGSDSIRLGNTRNNDNDIDSDTAIQDAWYRFHDSDSDSDWTDFDPNDSDSGRNAWNNDSEFDSNRTANRRSQRQASASDDIEQNEELAASCKVCLDSFASIKTEGGQIYSTKCGHLFCKECIYDCLTLNSRDSWRGRWRTSQCPICRETISINSIHRIFL